MATPRSKVLDEEKIGVYHCYSRCVRRAFLCGVDKLTGKNYEHRREWMDKRLEELSEIFAIDVFAYSKLPNHFHTVLRNRPDLAALFPDREVVDRWMRLFPRHSVSGELLEPDEEAIASFLEDPGRIAECRKRLSSISWMMRCLKEPIARRANMEDDCTGRFWEGRFHCQCLNDEGAILTCMTYVDLNPVRAKLAEGLTDSKFTSIYDRIIAKRAQNRLESLGEVKEPTEEQKRMIEREKRESHRADWLQSLSGEESPFGAGFDESRYIALVEWTGRQIRQDKPGYIPAELESVLDGFELDAQQWVKNVKRYGGLFQCVAGKVESLVSRAREKGVSWFCGRAGSRQMYRQEAG